nr:hypothetical protein [Tanacetum cinerariifolium]
GWRWRGGDGGGVVAAVVVGLKVVVARGGEWHSGSTRLEWRRVFCSSAGFWPKMVVRDDDGYR